MIMIPQGAIKSQDSVGSKGYTMCVGEGWFSPSQNSRTHSSAPPTSLKGWRKVRRTSLEPTHPGCIWSLVPVEQFGTVSSECRGRGTSPLPWEEHKCSSCAGKSFPQRLLPSNWSADKHPWELLWLIHGSWEEMFPLIWGWNLARMVPDFPTPVLSTMPQPGTLSSTEQPLADVGFVILCAPAGPSQGSPAPEKEQNCCSVGRVLWAYETELPRNWKEIRNAFVARLKINTEQSLSIPPLRGKCNITLFPSTHPPCAPSKFLARPKNSKTSDLLPGGRKKRKQCHWLCWMVTQGT